MTVGELKAILAPIEDGATLFMDSGDSAEITEVCDAIVDDQGDLIISDYYSDEEEEDEEETAEK